MNNVRFESIGLYLPEEELSTQVLLERMETPPSFDLEKITGIKTRRVKAKNEDSYTLALDAARNCLKKSRFEAHEIEAVICTSISRFKDGERAVYEPTLSLSIKNELGAFQALNYDISNACAGMTNGVFLLQNLIRSGVVQNGLVLSGECCTSLTETALKEINGPFSDQFASLTVGDSGVAVILDGIQDDNEGIDFVEFTTLSDYALDCLGLPSDKNPGVAMYSNSSKLSSMDVVQYIPRFIDDTLKKYDLTLGDYDYIIPHQTAVSVIKKHVRAVQEYFKVDKMPKILSSVEEYGNTSTTTHFVVLNNCLEQNLIEKGSRVLMMVAASGVVIGLTSFRI
ncbi:MAG: 3-oxoacyl-ACP synthase [Desulfobacteraceae bacterium]|nr:3-oxoacyl-ACP synthase [Desulfobacteraceae bacterium]